MRSDLRHFMQGLECAGTWCREGFWTPSPVIIEGQLKVEGSWRWYSDFLLCMGEGGSSACHL